jgi:hypothetical protein
VSWQFSTTACCRSFTSPAERATTTRRFAACRPRAAHFCDRSPPGALTFAVHRQTLSQGSGAPGAGNMRYRDGTIQPAQRDRRRKDRRG